MTKTKAAESETTERSSGIWFRSLRRKISSIQKMKRFFLILALKALRVQIRALENYTGTLPRAYVLIANAITCLR